MADPDKVPDSQMDTQATYDATVEEPSQDVQPTETSLLSESQDFQLIDEETDKPTEDETQVTQSNDEHPDTTLKPSIDKEKTEPSKSEAIKVSEEESEVQSDMRVSEQETETSVEKENVTCTETEEKKENTEIEEEEDDFIPSSQIESLSPLKKQISSLTGGVSQKRKAETLEEPQAKFPRTCSQEDALSNVRKKYDDDEDIFDTELPDETLDEAVTSNVIIQETQESCTAEGDSESLQQVEKELEEALSQQDVDADAKLADNEKSEKSSTVKVDTSTEEKKSSITEVLEEKIISTMTEAIEEKISSLTETTEEKQSSNGDATEETKSSNGDATEETKSSNGDATDETKSSNGDATEETKSSNSDAVKETKSSNGDAAEKTKSSNEDTAERTKSSIEDTAERTKSSIEDTAEKTKSSNEDTAERTKSSNEDTAEKTKSSNKDTAEQTKSSNEDTAEKTKSSNEDTAEKTKSPIVEVVEAEKSSVTELEAEKESPENEVTKTEETKSTDIEKSAVSSQGSKDSEKIESTPDTTAKEDSELNKDSPPVDTKDKEAETVEINAAQKSDDSGINSHTPDVSNKTQSEISPQIKVSSHKSRMSIEVIYDKATAPPEKKRPRELVEIDEDGEKIVLDSSQEGYDKSMEKSAIDKKIETSYKTCDSKTSSNDYKSVDTSKESSNDFPQVYSLTNGSAETKKTDSDETASPSSDLLAAGSQAMKLDAITPSNKVKNVPEVLISISDSEGDSFVTDERTKNEVEPANRQNPTIKIVEKELSILVKLKCLVHIDESTKEHVDKVITSVHSESTTQDLSSTRRRHSDASACLADISGNAGDNRDASPGSVTSNAQPYPLNARLSLASTISSSSASSAGSMNVKLAGNAQFQLPRLPVKHAKKTPSDLSTSDAKQDNEGFEQISKEWKHVGLLLTSFFNCAREELIASELHNGSTERVDNSLERIRSSTPEVGQNNEAVPQAATPKNTNKRGRTAKRPRSKTVQSSGSNGLTKTSPVIEAEAEVAAATPSSSRKRKSSPDTPSRQSTNSKDSLNDTNDELVGKEVFAKWSDNKYYPGTVIGKTKTKFKVNFYDGQNKLIIEDFIVPMPTTLQVGLSVYATSTDDDYGSCGIIIDAKRVKNNVIYTVQTDEHDEIRVQIKNIFLTNDQVQVLREETKVELKSPPSTPKHLGKVTLDNVVEGTRRSKRITTPVVLTPKAKRARGSLADKSVDISKPSSSGIPSKTKIEAKYDTMSDSNYSPVEETDMLGVQPELIGTPNEQETKGAASRLKGKARGRKKVEDPEVVAKLGPIPPANSKIFNGMNFLLTCASLEIIDRFQEDTKDSNSDPGTENEEEWTRKPFVRDRLVAQLAAGGGKLYENFELIPPEEYENTKLITNVPNLTKKSLLCLSVGIKAYNHQWIIRCCQENKIVNPSEEELPAGWSLMKQSYVEMFQRRNKKPFQTLPVIVVIPLIPGEKDFVTFWTQICQNAGGAVLLPENPDDEFIEGTVVLTNKRCPSWVIEKAKSWSIPLVSTTWVIQSLIEGNICTYDAHPSFAYNYVKRQLSHISNLKRLH